MKKYKLDFRRAFILSWLLLVVVMAGCVEKVDPDQLVEPEAQEEATQGDLRRYFPMVEGMLYRYAGEGNEYATFETVTKYVQPPYVQFHEDNGGTVMAHVYRVQEEQVDLMFEQGEFYQDTNIIDKLGEDLQSKRTILKTPLKVGNTWSSGNRKYEIIGVDEKLQVPAGTFHRVLAVKNTSTEENNDSEIIEYYAENVGLIMQEFQSQGMRITSRLAIYGMPVEPEEGDDILPETDQKVEDLSFSDPTLPLLAYQLERQLRAQFQAAYESYINLNQFGQESQTKFDQVIAVYREGIQPLTVESQVEKQIERLREFQQAGEGEVTFPTHEVVKSAKLIEKGKDRAQVAITLTRYYPEREWSGKAYDRTFDYIIDLVNQGGRWKIEKVNSGS